MAIDPACQPSLEQAMEALWIRFLPQMHERVDTLVAANESMATGTPDIDQRAAANSAAHKLAGVLGTFGLTKGTVLAREAEVLYSGEDEIDPSAVARLGEIAKELRVMIADHR